MINNIATYFQKHGHKYFVSFFKKLYLKCALNTNKSRIAFLRGAGAKIGDKCIIRDITAFGSEPWLIEIGDNVSFSSNVKIITHDGSVARLYHMGLTERQYDYFGQVKIGSNCFLGMNSIILKNVTVGNNVIIGAGSIVTKSIPDNCIVCGVPAKIIGTVNDFTEKNKAFFDDTINMTSWEKRVFIENNIEKYEQRRKERDTNKHSNQ